MTSNSDDIIRKVKGLMAKADSTQFEVEAESCLNLARDLLAKHGMSMEDVKDVKKEAHTGYTEATVNSWSTGLSVSIAKHTGCASVISSFYASHYSKKRSRRILFIGLTDNLAVCVYLFSTLHRQVCKLIDRYNESYCGYKQYKRLSAASYADGMIFALNKRLEERYAQEDAGNALVVVLDPVVQEKIADIDSMKPLPDKSIDAEAFRQGMKDSEKLRTDDALPESKKREVIDV